MAAAGSRPGAPGPIGHPRQDVRPAHPAPPAWQKGRARSGPSVCRYGFHGRQMPSRWPRGRPSHRSAVSLPASRLSRPAGQVRDRRPPVPQVPLGPPPRVPSSGSRRRCPAHGRRAADARQGRYVNTARAERPDPPPCRFGAGQDHQTRIARNRPAGARHRQPHAGFLTLLPVPWIIDARPRGSACRSG